MTAESPTPLTDAERAQLRDVWHTKRGACDEDCAAILYEVAESILLARETTLRETIAHAWDEGYRASGGDHWWTFEPGDECDQPHRPNPYRGQA